MGNPRPQTPRDTAGFSRWPWWRRWFGRRSERAAARFLRKLGYRVIAANVLDTAGEIDLIALDGETMVVVEVRSTASTEPNDLEAKAASVDAAKQRKITGAALRFLNRRQLLGKIAVRFDVLVIGWPDTAREPTVRHYPHAFDAVGRFQMFN